MKHLFKKSVLLILSILPLILFGQVEKDKKINFGIGIGVSINNVFNHVSNAEFQSRFSPILITANAQKQLGKKWSVLSELDYIHKGPKYHDINYLILSVLPQYRIFPKNITLLAGPYIAYMFKYESYGVVSKREDLKNYDVGADIGFLFSKKVNEKINLFLSPRVELGMMRFSFSNHLSYQLKMGVSFQ